MSKPDGEALFTFAVVSDSHVNAVENRSASPFASNRSANARFRHVVRELGQRRPAFVVHLGDMANPLPQLATYEAAGESFRAIAAELEAPLHLVPGNHCVGDKPTGWVPVPPVSRESLERYERFYGAHYSSFDHGPCHFATLNSLLINSGLKAERDQRRWLEKDLARASREGRRIWVMMHYPAYVATPDEPGSYDNLDEPGRSWLLEQLTTHDVEAAYSGHVHHYFCNRYVGTDLCTVPATSFVRQDYAEMFTVRPEDEEGGRDDTAKLGYCLVTVFEKGHVNRIVRTDGREARQAADRGGKAGPAPRPALAGGRALVGVEMRENWLQRLALRANNSVSPFVRRLARNDWPLLALAEMGVHKVRLSLQELAKPEVLERMATLRDVGYEFLVYSHGIPGERQYRLVRERRSLLAGWELILGLDQIQSVARGIARLPEPGDGAARLPVFLNEVRDPVPGPIADANVKHEANYGFLPEEAARIGKLVRSRPLVETFSGLVFRLRRHDASARGPAAAIAAIGRMGEASGMRHQVHVLFSGNLTADRLVDDLDTANRVAESAVAAAAAGSVEVYLDTFEDVDRGYFVRHGLVDRRYNPRLAARVLGHLGAALAGAGSLRSGDEATLDLPGARVWRGFASERFCALLLPERDCRIRELEAPEPVACDSLRLLDLETGEVSTRAVRCDGRRLRLSRALTPRRPLWIVAGVEDEAASGLGG